MKPENIQNDLCIAKKAAKESGKLLMENREEFNQRLNSNSKDTKLKADIESENLIKSIIKSQSNYQILSEETGKSSENLGEIFWVIDPLDGTANYNRDIPVCCVSIGLIKNMKPILGVIYDFNNDNMYVGETHNKISLMNDSKIEVSSITSKEDGILITGLPHNSDYSESSLNKMIDDMQKWQKIRMMGSAAMAACYVASGRAEQYQEKGVYLWDVIAGAAIVESSGGSAEISNKRENYQVDIIFSNSKI
ncbi:MAG: inositol monophosphatase [Rickettsiales bacterium]|nr:inositol monophosphatase [Rickettsiales bacterium]